MDDQELVAIARSIVDSNRSMTLGTADEDGVPWVSSPAAKHSRNLAARPQVAIVIFNSHRPGGWQAVSMTAVGEEVAAADADEGIAVVTGRSEEQGPRPWTRDDVQAPARHRRYRATVSEHFVLDDHDRRRPVAPG